MNRLLFLLALLIFSSCSQKKMISMISKTPDLDYEKPTDYDELNDYQKDAVYLSAMIKETYPRLETKISEEEFSKKSTQLIKDLKNVNTDFEFETYLKKYLALLKDGHSRLNSFILSLNEDTKYFNWYFLKEKEDWILTNIDTALDSTIVGLKVVSINNIPMREIEERVNKFEEGENPYFRFANFANALVVSKYWKALGVIDDKEEISFSVERNGKIEKYNLKATPKFNAYKEQRKKAKHAFTRKQNEGYSYKINADEGFAYLQMNTSLDYVSIKSEIKNYTSFFFRPFAKMYLKKDTKDARDFGAILQNMFTEINTKDINNLIVDLRYNGGGDERTGKQLIWYLTERQDIIGFTDYLQVSEYFKKTAKEDYKLYSSLYENKYNKPLPLGELNLSQEFYDQAYFYDITKADSPYLLDESIPKFKGNVYILTGAGTFSAAQFLATTIADNDLGKIVGTPVGNMPTCQTGASALKLPNTKTTLSLSYVYVERPDKSKNQEIALFPDIEAYQTYEDLLIGEDTPFKVILEKIKDNSSS